MAVLQLDPTRTTMIRRRFAADMQRRMKSLGRSIYDLVVTQDVFGLESGLKILRQEYKFLTDSQKVEAYRKWLQQQVNEKVLTTSGVNGQPWTSVYIQSAHRRGFERSYADVNKLQGDFYEGSKGEFIRSSFSRPELLSKVELLYTRAFNELKGVNDAMSQQMGRILADGLSQGKGPKVIARGLLDVLGKNERTRALVIARTEVIHAHAEGQLDSLSLLGVEEVNAQVEFSTAGDDRVCPQCADLEGSTYTIDEARGIIPVHPNCRCAWVPVIGDTKPVRDEGTKFATAEEYRQDLLTQISKKNLSIDTGKLKSLKDAANKAATEELMSGVTDKVELAALERKTEAAMKKYQAFEKNIKNNTIAQRKLLNETANKVGALRLNGTIDVSKFQNTTDDILSWIPKNRKSDSKFSEVYIKSLKSSQGGSYSPLINEIKLKTYSQEVYAHEFGHHIAYKSDGFMKAQNEFFKARTSGEELGYLKGTSDSIIGKNDKWNSIDPNSWYAGRVYNDGEFPEVASMGIEYLWTNPEKFAKADPDWFNMIVSQLKGIPVK